MLRTNEVIGFMKDRGRPSAPPFGRRRARLVAHQSRGSNSRQCRPRRSQTRRHQARTRQPHSGHGPTDMELFGEQIAGNRAQHYGHPCAYCGKKTRMEDDDKPIATADGRWWHDSCHVRYLQEKAIKRAAA